MVYTESDTTLIGGTNEETNSDESIDFISLLPLEIPIHGQKNIQQQQQQQQAADSQRQVLNFHDLYTYDSDNNPIYFHSFIGKIVLVANVATQCASSYQLRQFEELYQKYKDKDFVILAFPSNQFHQEIKGSNHEVAENCRKKFNVSFPIMEKVKVNGKNQCQVFKFLKENKRGFLNTKRVKWNFEKFLVGRDGTILKRYSTLENVKRAIEKDLAKIFEEEEGNKYKLAEQEREREIKKSMVQRVFYI